MKNEIFSNIDKLTLAQKKELIKKVKDISFDIHVDYLDCSESFRRQPIDLTHPIDSTIVESFTIFKKY